METLDYIYDTLNIPYPTMAFPQVVELPNFGRNDLAKLFFDLKFTIGAEIGVEEGVYSEVLLKSNPTLVLHSIDAWKSHRAYRDHTSQEKLDRFYENTKNKLNPFANRSLIIKKFSMDVVKDFKDRSLDFVYIDANHKFVEVANDIHHWGKKVRKGGIVAGHDYTKYKDLEVEIHPPYVIEGYTKAYQIAPYFVIGENVDPVKSWFWVQTQE